MASISFPDVNAIHKFWKLGSAYRIYMGGHPQILMTTSLNQSPAFGPFWPALPAILEQRRNRHSDYSHREWEAYPLLELRDRPLHHSLTSSRLWKQSSVFPEINRPNGYSMMESCQVRVCQLPSKELTERLSGFSSLHPKASYYSRSNKCTSSLFSCAP